MGSTEGLFDKAERVSDTILREIRQNRNILLMGHLDADGITSAGIMARAIRRKKGRFIVRISSNPKPETLLALKEGGYAFYIFCELGAGLAKQMKEIFGERWVVVDHHQIGEDEMGLENVLSSWQFGFDGAREVSAAGMSYFVAKEMDECNVDLSWLAVVGALADRQDQGKERAMLGLNELIVKDAIESGYLRVERDLMLYGRETRPIHEALASTMTTFIPGLTGNRDACLATLSSAGLRLKEGGRWRTVAELSLEEKSRVVEAIIPYLVSSPSATVKVMEYIGNVYTLVKEDEYTSLRDAREFGTLLNACGRMEKASVGVAICLGDRDLALQEGIRVLTDYRLTLNRYIQSILGDEGKIVEGEKFFMIVGDGLVHEDMVSSLSSILSGTPRFEGKALLARTITKEGEYTFSARRTRGCSLSINLGAIMAEAASACGGVGGGHDVAAGAKVPLKGLNEFVRFVNEGLKRVVEDRGRHHHPP